MDAREIETELEEIETRIERLRALYEQYFMGIEKLEPQIPRKDVDRRIWAMRREQIRNTGLRFKFQMLFQRYNTFQQYWGRITREIENGTYRRDVIRAAKRFGEKEALTIVGRKRAEQFKLLAAAKQGKEERQEQPPIPDAAAAPSPRSDDFDDDDTPTPPAHRVEATIAMGADLAESSPVSRPRGSMGADLAESSPVSRPRGSMGIAIDEPSPVSRPRGPMGAAIDEPGPVSRPRGLGAALGPPEPITKKIALSPPIAPPPPSDQDESSTFTPILPPAPLTPSLDLRWGPPPATPKSSDKGDAEVVKKRVAALAAQLKTPRGAATADTPPVGLDLDLDLEPSSRRRKSAMPSRRPSGRMKSVRVPPLPLPPDLLSEAPVSAPQPSSRRARAKESVLPSKPSTRPPASKAPPAAAQPASRTAAPTPIGGIPLTRRAQAPAARAAATPPSGDAAPRAPAGGAPRSSEAERERPQAPARVEDDAGLPDQRLRQIYSKYVETRRAAHESTAGLTYEKLAASLRAQAVKLKATHRKKNVDYDVIVKDGKTVLKPILR